MVDFKEDHFRKLERRRLERLSKIQEILPEYMCEDGDFFIKKYIHLYRSKKVLYIFRSAIEYIGEIYYDSKTPSKLNIIGNLNLIKPVAKKLEKHGYQVTKWVCHHDHRNYFKIMPDN